MDLGTMVSLFFSMLDNLKLLANAREIIDIILASLKKYFGQTDETTEA